MSMALFSVLHPTETFNPPIQPLPKHPCVPRNQARFRIFREMGLRPIGQGQSGASKRWRNFSGGPLLVDLRAPGHTRVHLHENTHTRKHTRYRETRIETRIGRKDEIWKESVLRSVREGIIEDLRRVVVWYRV